MASWIATDPILGTADVSAQTTVAGPMNVQANTGSGRMLFPGQELNFRNNDLGAARHQYLRACVAITSGNICETSQSMIASAWAGTANSGRPLAVATTTLASGEYGWFQKTGNAVITCSGTVAAGDKAFYAADATVKTASGAGKQVLNCVAVTANGGTMGNLTVASTNAIYNIDYPFAQGQIS